MTAPHRQPSGAHDEDESDERELDERERAAGLRRLKIDLALVKHPELTALEERLYKHVVDCIDFNALSGLEQMLWCAVDRLGHGALDDESGLSHRLIERAVTRAAHDVGNTFTDVPFGITKAEQRAVRFDPECLFCEVEDQAPVVEPASGDSGHDHDDEPCPLCDDMARDWRQQHAGQLHAAVERRTKRRTVAGSRTH